MNRYENERDSPCTSTFTSLKEIQVKLQAWIEWSENKTKNYDHTMNMPKNKIHKRPIYVFKFIAWYLVIYTQMCCCFFSSLVLRQNNHTPRNRYIGCWSLEGHTCKLKFGYRFISLFYFYFFFMCFKIFVCVFEMTIFNRNCHDLVTGFWTD